MRVDQPDAGTTQIQSILDLATQGRTDAYDKLITVASENLFRLTHKMLRAYPHLRRWEETDDVFQNAAIRLHRALSEVRPNSVREFFGLAVTQIRRELIDLARHHFGPEGHARKHDTNVRDTDGGKGELLHQTDDSDKPETLLSWAEFHETVGSLPPDLREVFSLLWYAGTTQKEAAQILGVSERTVIRRCYQARLILKRTLTIARPTIGKPRQNDH